MEEEAKSARLDESPTDHNSHLHHGLTKVVRDVLGEAIAKDTELFFSEYHKQHLNDSNSSSDSATAVVEYVKNCMREGTAEHVIKAILVAEVKTATGLATMFREDSVGIMLLTQYWKLQEGQVFVNIILAPAIDRVMKIDRVLEVSSGAVEKAVNVKGNYRILTEILVDFLRAMFRENVFSHAISMKFLDTTLSLVAGLLFLRLICPALISPAKYITKIKPDDIKPHTHRNLVNLAKILQKIATGAYDQLKYVNRFVRKIKPEWNAYFHRLLTGEELRQGNFGVDVTPEDLIDMLIPDTPMGSAKEDAISKQSEVIRELMMLEKQSENWKEEPMKYNITLWMKKLPGGRTMGRAVGVIDASVEEVFLLLRDNPTAVDPNLTERKVVEKFTDNLAIEYRAAKLPKIMTDRDCVLLQYSDILTEDNFAIISGQSIERKDCPDVKGYIRCEFMGGYIMRGVPNNPRKCSLTYTFWTDGKGMLGKLPKFVLKNSIKITAKNIQKMREYFQIERSKQSKTEEQ